MVILGISAFFHDAAAALVIDGKVVAAAQEERFSRIKNDASFPSGAIRFCLSFSEIEMTDVDAVVFYDKPLLKFERLLESYHATAPYGLTSFLKAMPIWIRQKLMMKKTIRNALKEIQPFDENKIKLLFCPHHLSHAAGAFFTSPYKEAAIITIDGVGEWTTTSIAKGEDDNITVLKEISFPHSLGLLYSSFTYYLGFRVNSGEYKLMGLAPYGDETSEQFNLFREKILKHLCTIKEDGSFTVNQEYFNYLAGLTMVKDEKWKELFGIHRRIPESPLLPEHCNLALAIQKITEEIILRLAATAKKITGFDNLCLSGGVALNCVANGKLLESAIFKNIYIQPAAGDAGGSIGCALAAHYIYFGGKRVSVHVGDSMQNVYLGPSFSISQVNKMVRNRNLNIKSIEPEEALAEYIAAALKEGKVVGWFQDRMEFGPRALGNRSILADARDEKMQERLNHSIKFRENFRPFAPVCTVENAAKYFNLCVPSPYMLFTRNMNPLFCYPLPEEYKHYTIAEKLHFRRSKFPSITHVDFSCRVQTVSEYGNRKLWRLLQVYEQLTGHGILINTSFNVRGEPIVCSPEDAYNCFMKMDMDILVINNFIFLKSGQGTQQISRPEIFTD